MHAISWNCDDFGVTDMTDWLTLARRIRQELFTRFLEPQTKQLVTYTEHWLKGHIPTPEEISRAIPNAPSYSTGIEDGTLRGSALLAQLCDEYELTSDPEVKTQAHTLFAGLCRAQNAARPMGFVPRWVLADGESCYPNSSGDQHTILFYGLWRYVNSPLASDRDKADAATIAERVVCRIRDHDWCIAAKDGQSAHAGGQLTAARLLAVLMAAHRLTGQTVWRDVYEQKASEDLEEQLNKTIGPGPFTPAGWGFYGPQQQSELLTLLIEEDEDPERNLCFRNTRNEIARRFLNTPIPTTAHCPIYSDSCRAALTDAAHIETPFDVLRVFKHDLWGKDEDRDWRVDFQRWLADGNAPVPNPYILWWLGRRPALCHERNCAISPLVAFQIALLCGDPELERRVMPAAEAYFAAVDICRAGKVGSLSAAHGLAVLAARAAPDPANSRRATKRRRK